MTSTLFGLRVVVSPHIVETKYRFPKSRHRSKRTHKKLVKRFGQQTYSVPAALHDRNMHCLHVHPAIYEKLQQEAARDGRVLFG